MRVMRIATHFWNVFRVRDGFEELAGQIMESHRGGYWAHPARWGSVGEPLIGDAFPFKFSSVAEAAEALT